MSITFGWWHKDPVEGKYQINAVVHGGNIEWTRHQGHHSSWLPLLNQHPLTSPIWMLLEIDHDPVLA